jgi:diadenosine tetraphosphate (Ap4A) HIT family hydrolase
MLKEDCLGCRLANHLTEAYVIYENDLLTCILDIAPIHEGHILILPKHHVVDHDELDQATALAIMIASAELSRALKACYQPDGITIMQNGGSFNDLGHYHMHVFPRFDADGFGWVESVYEIDLHDRLDATHKDLKEALQRIRVVQK